MPQFLKLEEYLGYCQTTLLFHKCRKQSLMKVVSGVTIITQALGPVLLSPVDSEGPLVLFHDQNRIWLVFAIEHSTEPSHRQQEGRHKYILLNLVFGGWQMAWQGRQETGIRHFQISTSLFPLLIRIIFRTLNKPNISLSTPLIKRNTKICHLSHLLLKRAEKNMNSHSHTPVPHSFQRLTSQVFLLFGFSVSKPKWPLWQWREVADLY